MPGFLLSTEKQEIEPSIYSYNLDKNNEYNTTDRVEISLDIFLSIFFKYRYWLLFWLAIGILSGIIIYKVLPKKYRAEALILCNINDIKDKGGKETITALKNNSDTLLNFITSDFDKNKLIKELKKHKKYTAKYLKHIDSQNLTSFITISVVDGRRRSKKNIIKVKASFPQDNYMPVFLANYFAKMVVNSIIQQLKLISQSEISILNKTLKSKQNQLKKLNKSLMNYIQRPEFIDNTLGESYLVKNIFILEEELQKTIVQKKTIKSEIDVLKKQIGVNDISLEKIQWISANNSIVRKISELKIKRDILLAKYTKQNPKIIQLNYQIKLLEKLIKNNNQQTKKVIIDENKSRLITELALKFAKYKSINLEIEALKTRRENILKRLVSLPLHDRGLKTIMKQREILQDSIKQLLTSIDQKLTFISKLNSVFTIVKKAKAPAVQYYPSKIIYTICPIIVIFIFVFIQLIRYTFGPIIIDEIDTQFKLQKTCAAIIPYFKEKDNILKNIRPIMSKLINSVMMDGDIKIPTILVTSANKKEGKSFIASWFAIIASQLNYKTLVVKIPDTEDNNVYPGRMGLLNFLSQDKNNEWSIIWKTKWKNLYCIPPGELSHKNDTSEQLDRSKLNKLLFFARTHFDLIILDGGCLPQSLETIIFLPYVDKAFVVIASKKDKVKEVRDVFNVIGGNKPIKIILNNVT